MSMPLSQGPSTLERRKAIRSRAVSQPHRPVSLPQDFAPQPFSTRDRAASCASTSARPTWPPHESPSQSQVMADLHRLSISSISSATTCSTLDTPLPTTPPLRPTELAALPVVEKYEHQPHPTQLLLNRAPSDTTLSSSSHSQSHSHAYPDADPFDAEVVRQTRKRMAQQLLEKRKLERESSGNLGTILSPKSRSDETHIRQWSADRETRFAEWEKRAAEGMASLRKIESEIERQRSFRAWQRAVCSEKARSHLMDGAASSSRRKRLV